MKSATQKMRSLSKIIEEREERRQKAISTLESFIRWTATFPSPHFIFRGQAGPWPMIPTVGRKIGRYKLEKEIQMLRIFKRHGKQDTEQRGVNSDWEWLSIAQHHGLPTRLLDWTANALVAAYFANMSEQDEDGLVFVLRTPNEEFIDIGTTTTGPFDIVKTVFFYPPTLAMRISAQRGLFSAHANPSQPFNPSGLREFRFPHELKSDMRKLLHRMGFDEHYLMGGLDGLTATLKWRFLNGMALES